MRDASEQSLLAESRGPSLTGTRARGGTQGDLAPRFGITGFTLKMAAIIGMACNHIANVFCYLMPDAMSVVLYSLGGLTFPIMAFLLVEGYFHTSDVRKYALRLAVFALISQVPYSLLWGATPNVLWTLLVGLGLLWAFDNLKPRWLFLPLFLAAYFVTAPFDWGGVGVAMIMLFYLLRNRRGGAAIVMLVPLIASIVSPLQSLADTQALGFNTAEALLAIFDFDTSTTPLPLAYDNPGNHILQAGFYVTNFGLIGYATLGFGLATLLIGFYSGKRGKPLKLFFYAFYPAHLALIWLLSLLV